MAAVGNAPLSSLGATLNEAVIPLIPKIKVEDLDQVSLTVYRPVGAGNNIHHEKKKASVPKCIEEDPESLLRTVVSFLDACDNNRLHLNTGALRYEKFRECLGGNILDTWDTVCINAPNTLAGFQQALQDLIAQYIVNTAQSDQAQYLQNCRKPFRLSCFQLGGRLGYINKLMAWFPGNNGNVPFDDAALKHMYYRMMLEDWKLAFLSSGRDINVVDFLEMQRYMSNQEKAARAKARRQQAMSGQKRQYPKMGRGNYQPLRGGMRRAGRRRFDSSGGGRSTGYSTYGYSNSSYSGGRGFARGGSSGGRGFARGGGRFGSAGRGGRAAGRGGRSGGRSSGGHFRQQSGFATQQDQYHMDSMQVSPRHGQYEEQDNGQSMDYYENYEDYEQEGQDNYYAEEEYYEQEDQGHEEHKGEDNYYNEDQEEEAHWMDHLNF